MHWPTWPASRSRPLSTPRDFLSRARPWPTNCPPGSDNLSPKSRAAVIQMLRVLIDLESNHDEHDHPDQHQDRERGTAERGGARGGDAGAGQKTAAAGAPADFDLAAHPDFELTRDRQAREWGDVGEESTGDRDRA